MGDALPMTSTMPVNMIANCLGDCCRMVKCQIFQRESVE